MLLQYRLQASLPYDFQKCLITTPGTDVLPANDVYLLLSQSFVLFLRFQHLVFLFRLAGKQAGHVSSVAGTA